MKCITGIGKGSLKNSKWGFAYAGRFDILAEGHVMFRLGATASGRKMNLSGNLSFTKRTLKFRVFWLVAPCSHVEVRRFRGVYCLHNQGDEKDFGWLDGCVGVEPRRDGIALTEGLCYFVGNHFG